MRTAKINSLKASAAILVMLIMMATDLPAFEADYVGSISESLFAPTGLVIDEDRLAVLEPYKRQISLYTPDGRATVRIDIEGDASGLTRISENDYLFCDRDRKEIVRVNIVNGEQDRYFISGSNLSDPVDVESGSQRYYILDAGSKEIIILDSGGRLLNRFSLIDSTGEEITFPSNFVYNETKSAFYLFDQTSSRIWVFSYSGDFLNSFGAFGSSEGEISRGGDIACDPDGNIYIADRFQGRIAVFDPGGEFISNINLADFGQPDLLLPTGIDIDEQGFVYVSSTEGRSIHILYVHPESSPRRVITALQAYPADDDTVEAEDLELVAYIESNPDGYDITGLDFQIFAGNDTSEIVDENINVAPEIESIENVETIVSRWLLENSIEDKSSYQWRVRARSDDIAGEWSSLQKFHTLSLPRVFALHQNYPNPFNPVTHIAFETPIQSDVAVTIYNTLGQIVKSFAFTQLSPGKHDLIWDGRSEDGDEVASGIYFYRMTSNTFNKTRKMALLK
ncbi:MAG: T9SS type A sorting domain-containing protein [Candidatus Zixiibacteriota bacterium]|nr:MAG: T9SS type A sorting domain-containing protein [candidate division Zixibacteria bacterium]